MFLNQKRMCVAGIGADGYISAYITYHSDKGEPWIDVMGLDNRKKLYVRWAWNELHTGDEILLKIVDRQSVNKYKKIRRLTEKSNIGLMKRHTRKMAESFGWEIRERRKTK